MLGTGLCAKTGNTRIQSGFFPIGFGHFWPISNRSQGLFFGAFLLGVDIVNEGAKAVFGEEFVFAAERRVNIVVGCWLKS